MRATDDLIQEHKAIIEVLDIMSKIADNIKTKKGFYTTEIEEIINFVKVFADKCHQTKEETVLFPALVLAGIPEDNSTMALIRHEHSLCRGLIKDISDCVENCKIGFPFSCELIADSLNNYVYILRNHFDNEEEFLFPLADKTLTDEQQNEIFEQFEKIKQGTICQDVYKRFDNLLTELKRKYRSIIK